MDINIKQYSLNELEELFKKLNIEKYRGRQVFQWLWQKNTRDFMEMTNLSIALRKNLSARYVIRDLRLLKNIGTSDGVQKFLWELEDRDLIESVFIPEPPRRTICVSTQVGCPLGCLFCATGLIGFKRNLKGFEIAAQIQRAQEFIGEKMTNIVFMGMGEPLLNIENLFVALEIVTSSIGLGISQRHITISTSGIIEGMEKLLNSKWKVKLAISLNFVDQAVREKYMPVAKNNPLKEILHLARLYSEKKEMVTFEYVLIRGLNDKPDDARRLIRLLKGFPSKINLISYNEYPELPYQAPEPERILEFQKILFDSEHPVTLRKSKGKEILAGCGQLVARP
ncbi:MAG: 23S rRNA (adenine(2503)-C(2))-methyltransferase RlmN [candidate division WOR-3 bacterium]|nr:23S rRNA (adenine(2503)-C(2))-methyltransferase RlmN [candidate division WOR-3 bacterium]